MMLKIYRIILSLSVIVILLSCIVGNSVAADKGVNATWGTVTELWNRTANNAITCADVSQDGSYVAFGSKDTNIYYYDETGTKLWNHTTNGAVGLVSVSDDGNYVAAGSDDMYAYYFNESGSLQWKYNTTNYVFNVDVSSLGDYVVTGDNNNTIHFFTKNGGPGSYDYQWYYSTSAGIASVQITKNGEFVLAYSWFTTSKLYYFNGSSYLPADPTTTPNTPKWTFTAPYNANIQGASMSNYGEYIVCYDDNSRVHLLNGTDGKTIWTFKANYSNPTAIISGDGNYILVSDSSARCTLISKSSPIPLWSIDVSFSTSFYISENADRIYVSNSSYPNNQILWLDRASGTIRDSADITFSGYTCFVFFSGDGTHFAQYDTSSTPDKIHYYSLNMVVPEFPLIILPAIIVIGMISVARPATQMPTTATTHDKKKKRTRKRTDDELREEILRLCDEDWKRNKDAYIALM